jgi:hypothetical protein
VLSVASRLVTARFALTRPNERFFEFERQQWARLTDRTGVYSVEKLVVGAIDLLSRVTSASILWPG